MSRRRRHVLLQKAFALKLIRSSVLANEDGLRRFEVEARALGKLTHPNIVRVTDYGVEPAEKTPYLVMELLAGVPLNEMIKAHGALPLGEALPILKDIAEGLDYAHAQGILHRDLKPHNVIVAEETGQRVVKIVDFGLARFVADTSSIEQNPAETRPHFAFISHRVPVASESAATIAMNEPILQDQEANPGLVSEAIEPIYAPLEKDAQSRPKTAYAVIKGFQAAYVNSALRTWRRRELPRRALIGSEIAEGTVTLILGHEDSTRLFGYANLMQDRNSSVRHFALGFEDLSGAWHPTLSHRIASIIDNELPQPGDSMLVDYRIDWHQIPRFSWKDLSTIIAEQPDLLARRFLLVGGDIAGFGEKIIQCQEFEDTAACMNRRLLESSFRR